MTKPGRNSPCPCGSGRKFKRCHGSFASDNGAKHEGHHMALARVRAQERRRIDQQGLGRPIVAHEIGDGSIVAVGNTLFHGKNVRTFHDFLFRYIIAGEP
jgi:hypothetical protein